MSEVSEKYNRIIKDLEENIKDPKELEFVKDKFSDLSMLFIDMLDRVTKLSSMRMQEIENKQQEIAKKINSVQSMVDEIESDIYEDDIEEGYEFEIVCPYCGYQFTSDINDNENKEEIECPHCNNVIELDWNMEEECLGSCSHCHTNCVAEDEVEYKENNNNINNENDEDNNEDM